MIQKIKKIINRFKTTSTSDREYPTNNRYRNITIFQKGDFVRFVSSATSEKTEYLYGYIAEYIFTTGEYLVRVKDGKDFYLTKIKSDQLELMKQAS